ncbi:MAG: hypothetical protein LBH53_00195 [Puniceicoccales bacterium]|jgi:bifunctional N-acetylglucosamine-1-phosphate-uridyltransferase/glucosamine-1-phosphate-acetyltransferase GlmU-like protein|nr:hypothetical protein [Puniceicoccales bacterium]
MEEFQLFGSWGSLAPWQEFFEGLPFWLWPSHIEEALNTVTAKSAGRDFFSPAKGIVVHHSAMVGPSSFLRPPILLGANCVVGSSCEVKGSILMDGATVAHLNYVGDSVLGSASHLGAGAVLSNLRLDGQSARIQLPSGPQHTDLRKLGAFLGDGAQVGCNSVLQPGTVLGRGASVHPCLAFGDFLPADAVASRPERPTISVKKSTRAEKGSGPRGADR